MECMKQDIENKGNEREGKRKERQGKEKRNGNGVGNGNI